VNVVRNGIASAMRTHIRELDVVVHAHDIISGG